LAEGARHAVIRWTLAAVLLWLFPAWAQPACGVGSPCQLTLGSYRAAPPAGWDGRAPLPKAVFFHGARGSAADGMADEGLRADFANAGVLVILPDGL